MIFFVVGLVCIVKYVNHITKLCIIRVSREEYQDVWSAITMVRSIASIPVAIYLLDLTGKPQKMLCCCHKIDSA